MLIEDQKRKTAFNRINDRRQRPWVGEEEVRLAWISALEFALDIHFDAERARKDSSYNNIIIEFKAPGLFKGSKNSAKFKEAINDRLLPYIQRDAQRTGIPEDDYIGIAIDGEHVCFAQLKGEDIFTEHLLPFSEYSLGLVIQAVRADVRRSITIDNLVADFGHGSNNAKALMQAMSDALSIELEEKSNSKIRMLYEEWHSLYGQVADMSRIHTDLINKEICFDWKGSAQHEMSGRLFVIHTYNSMLIKLLAAEIVSGYGLSSVRQPAQEMSSLDEDNKLISSLSQQIERAEIFSQAGIRGFVEEAIFSWYLDVAQQNRHAKMIVPAIRNLLATLSLYRTDRLSHTRDVLRDLYQALVPGRLRQSLGEFYTPDWLVEFVIRQLEEADWTKIRILDPTCGSGAFLIHTIRRKIEALQQLEWQVEDIISHLCSSIWGFDLNPLAVQTARVNFLMEIAGLLRDSPGTPIEIPVLLADAIYSPAPNPKEGEVTVRYQIGSPSAGLDIHLPAQLAFDRSRLDRVFDQMGESVESNLSYSDSENLLIKSSLLSESEAIEWKTPLQHTYNQILSLHKLQWNGIWFRVVRNFFWSATAGYFDYVVGNPPWVRWSKLPDLYRERVKPTCEQYGIFSKTKRHGGNELDISAMITYAVADKWLNQGGLLAFVITGSLFKNPSSAGFRDFKLSSRDYLVPVKVDDLKSLKPFSDATNHTTVALFYKSSQPPTYPVSYSIWQKLPGERRSISTNAVLDDVLKRVSVSTLEAFPVGAEGSPWAVLKKDRYQVLQMLAGTCEWIEGRKGITTDLNGVYFVPIIQNNKKLIQIRSRPEAGKKDIGSVRTAWVEPDTIYPLVKGASDFEACYLKLSKRSPEKLLYTFLPNTGIGKAEYQECRTAMNSSRLSRTKKWFSNYQSLLEDRSTYRRQMKGAPFYAIYNVGEYTFKPWKVLWPEMSSKFYAAVAGSADVPIASTRPYVPDHKVYYAAFDSKAPAYFLCGLLNADMVTEWVESHNVSIQVGDVFKHMKLPMYDENNHEHIALATLVESSHNEHNKKKRDILLQRIKDQGESTLNDWVRKS